MLPPLQTPIASPRLSPTYSSDWLAINQHSYNHHLRFDPLLEQLTELREMCLLVYHTIKDIDEQLDEETSGKSRRVPSVGGSVPMDLGCTALPAREFVHQSGSFPKPTVQGFSWRLHYIGMINY